MSYCRQILLILGIAIAVPGIKAQESFTYNFRNINHADGLLHNDVLSITQDNKGFIWLATTNGLQRYDGKNFINYTPMLSKPAEAFEPGVELCVNKQTNQLWISHKNYTEKMEFGKADFSIYEPAKLTQKTTAIFSQYKDLQNQQWLVAPGSIYFYDSAVKMIRLGYLNIHPKNDYQASYVAEDSNGNIWIANYRQLYLLNKKDSTVYSNISNPAFHPLLNAVLHGTKTTSIRFVMADSRQNIWVTTWADILYKYDNSTQKVSIYSLSDIKEKEAANKIKPEGLLVNCMIEDNDHAIWAGTENAGLLRYDPVKDNFDYCIAAKKNSEGIQYNYKIFSLYQDREKNIWAGTDKGISIFNPSYQNFKSIHHEENNALSINNNEVEAFIQTTDGNLFIGTWGGGIAVYNNKFEFKKNIIFSGNPDKNKVWSFIQDDDKTLWIGCQHGYLLIYNLTTGETKTLLPPEMQLSTIRCMAKDNEGNIWFGLHNGQICKWDKKLNQFFGYLGFEKDNAAKMSFIYNIFIDQSQHCWVSTVTGFKEFDLNKRMYINSWTNDNRTNSLSGKNCQGIEEYNDSILIVGAVHGGINFFNKKTKIFSHLTTADGLPSNTIYALKKDAAGYIWFTTDYGIYKFIPANKKFIPFGIENGIINSPFKSVNFYSLQDGRWLTCTATEAISFSPYQSDDPNKKQVKTEITGFKIFNKPVFIDSLIYKNNPLTLSYKENFFTIEFATLIFSGLQQTNYYYRLSGIDKDWVNGGTTRFANYTGLQPGEYIFEVRSENGNSNGEITSLKIIIVPPFWKTWWFITIIISGIVLLIYAFIIWREKNIKTIAAAKLKLQQVNAEQYKTKLELEQIINYFSTSLIDKNTVDDVLWDVAKNLIGRLGFVDCMIYLWDDDKTKMMQRAGFGPKGSIEEINKQPFDVLPGQGVVGFVMQTKEAVLIPDTSQDSRYRPDEMQRLSEIAVPLIYNNELIGVIDSEHPEKNFYTTQHLQLLTTIATLVANKIKSIEAEQSLQRTTIEIYSINEQLGKAKLEALRSQMNPHFIFNSLNAIDNLIQTNQKDKATTYLARFAKLIRNVLDSSKNDMVYFQKDYETLQLYLQLEQFRCSDKFSYDLQADEELMNSDYEVLPLIVQPFVENAIHHGLLNKQEGDRKLTVSAVLENDYIKYTVTDNGVGRSKALQLKNINKPEHKSYGIDITTERIQLYNKNGESNVVSTDLFENNIPSGTKVEIKLRIFEKQ